MPSHRPQSERAHPSKRIEIADGLYRVEAGHFVAGFVVEKGRVTECAPILRKRLAYWMKVAVRITD